MTESLLLGCDAEVAAQAATAVMIRRGLQVVRSFDLHTVSGAHGDCTCPYHGTADCTCQYVVLLVYGESSAPATLTFHSRDAQAQAQIVRDAYNQPEAGLVEKILAALLEAALELHAAAAQLAKTQPRLADASPLKAARGPCPA